MVLLDTSVQASVYQPFQRMKQISHFCHEKHKHNHALIEQFVTLVSKHCTFVDSWNLEALCHLIIRCMEEKYQTKNRKGDL